MQHGMPQSLIVFTLSNELEIPDFGTFRGVATMLLLKNYFFNIINVYMHILNKIKKHNKIKFRMQNPFNSLQVI